jgi:tRNA-2-methylthio-N6-dimethylallyladenosine synthase
MAFKVLIRSFGCQMNKLDTALVRQSLKQNGYELCSEPENADIVIFNTCSVRARAEEKVISQLGYIKHLKKDKPDIVAGVIGCMAQRLGEKLLEDETIDFVCSPAHISKVPELVRNALKKQKRETLISDNIRKINPENTDLENFESVYDKADKNIPSQAFVRIMRGCNNFCSYCIVPYVRGQEVSRPPENIIDQVKRLASQNVKLVTLLGQTVNSYEYKSGEKIYSLADILNMVSEIDGIEWLRFVTSYPSRKYYEDILKVMRDNPKVCRYLHIPAQSGSDKILKAMNRKYTAAEYLQMIQKAKDIVGQLDIAGDFIVGFPGESQQDFEDTVRLVRKVRYKNCFVFKYSPRPGTSADRRLKNPVPENIKKQRNNQLLKVQEQISGELSKKFQGKTVKVLVEGLSKKPHLNKNQSSGRPQLISRTEGDRIVVFNGDEKLAGEFVNVKISKTAPLTLFGQLT